jgi:hypothetical protein
MENSEKNEREKELLEIAKYSPEEILNFIKMNLISVDTVLNGIYRTDKITELSSIFLTSLERLSDALESTEKWIKINVNYESPTNFHNDDDL